MDRTIIDERFHDFETIRETEHVMVWHAKKVAADAPVIVCALTKKNMSLSDQARFLKEYETLRSLDHGGLLRILEVENLADTVVLVFENCRHRSLSEVWRVLRPTLSEFFQLALTLTDILHYIHSRKIYHGNLTPRSILVAGDYKTVKVTEFGVDLLITDLRSRLYDEEYIKDYLPYLAPEQTGRINRNEDYRSDFYSLGVVLFELLTGVAPFRSKDPLELIHAHIARTPVFPADGDLSVPSTLMEILLKLMAKSPEERYQSASGIKADLEECRKRIRAGGEFEPFVLGTRDDSDRFIVPLKLYGRDKELETLLGAFDDVCRGNNRLLLVTGEAGIGKSALVREMDKPVLSRRGYLISGKYEQYKSDSPYSAIIQAFKSLIHQLLSQSEQNLSVWRSRFISTLGANAGVITDFFPDLELIVGKQPEPAQLGAEEARNRFNLCFESFVSLFVADKRPLVLFLDDLQWVDFSSISLLKNLLVSFELQYLYVIFSYRDNEVDDAHPFTEMIQDIRNQGMDVTTLSIGPLTGDMIGNLIVDFLKCSPERAHNLADLIFRKTAGNPFFVHQILRTLHDRGIITHDPARGWGWEDAAVSSVEVTTNVLELMMEKISDLPEQTREIVTVSACMGSKFEAELLSEVTDRTLYDVIRDLKPSVDEGYIHHEDTWFRFNHDRIQEAAYALIPVGERAALHLAVGKGLLSRFSGKRDLDTRLFYITDQLNLGSDRIEGADLMTTLLDLNVRAGIKAKKTAAFDPALKYFLKAENLLDSELVVSSGRHFDVYREIADLACLLGDYERMDRYVSKALSLKPSISRRVDIGDIETRSFFARLDYRASLAKSKELLADLGVVFPDRVTKKHIAVELIKIKWKIRGMSNDDFLFLPRINDERQLAIAKIYYEMGLSASLSDYILYGYIALKRFDQVLEHGQHKYAGLCFLGYGSFLAAALQDIESGIRFGEVALAFCERPENAVAKHKVHSIYSAQISQWSYPLDKCKTFADRAYRLSREAGDQIYTSLALMFRDFMAFLTTSNLKELMLRVEKRVKISEQTGQRPIILLHKMILQMLEHLTQDREITPHLRGDSFDDRVILSEWIETKNFNGLGHYYIILIRNHYQLCDYEKARECLTKITQHWKEIQNMMAGRLTIYYECLNELARFKVLSKKEQRKTMVSVKKTLKTLRGWDRIEGTKHIPWIHLIEAERARVLGDHGAAPGFYDESIRGFREIPSPVFTSLALFRAGLYYKERGLETEASCYLTETARVLEQCGARMYLKHLRDNYAENLSLTAVQSGGQDLDMATIIKGAQALSGEIVLDKLTKTIMTLSLESAGARKGFLILTRGGNLVVASELHLEKGGDEKEQRQRSLETRNDLALSVVNYVARTLKSVVLGNACVEGDFTADPYISGRKVKSLLAAPVVSSGKLKGIIYLENNLAFHVFSEKRIRILDVLASQAAISLENARLFEDVMKAEADLRSVNLELEDRVEQRTRELKSAYDSIMSSIRYAGVIQHSLLPSDGDMASVLPLSMIIWQPRDIVGGDIYTCDRVKDGVLVSVIDCTGHGVPGAFMTMLAGSAIRRIIREEDETDPARILMRLNRIIKTLLHQDKDQKLSNDGLDAGICFYHERDRQLYFAGAGIPLYIVDEQGLNLIKGNKQSIGYVSSRLDYSYTTHGIDDREGSKAFYLATDGFQDQLEEEKKSRFGSKKLKALLAENHTRPFDEQKERLLTALQAHQSDYHQTDDITLMGFRFDKPT